VTYSLVLLCMCEKRSCFESVVEPNTVTDKWWEVVWWWKASSRELHQKWQIQFTNCNLNFSSSFVRNYKTIFYLKYRIFWKTFIHSSPVYLLLQEHI